MDLPNGVSMLPALEFMHTLSDCRFFRYDVTLNFFSTLVLRLIVGMGSSGLHDINVWIFYRASLLHRLRICRRCRRAHYFQHLISFFFLFIPYNLGATIDIAKRIKQRQSPQGSSTWFHLGNFHVFKRQIFQPSWIFLCGSLLHRF